jgi:hypothetical protein
MGALEANAQEGQVVYATCLSGSEPTCGQVPVGSLLIVRPDCTRDFPAYNSRIAFWTIYNQGPIRIDIEARTGSGHSIAPLYVEILPMKFPETRPCDDALGYVVGTINGLRSECYGYESIGPIDISSRVPLGRPYAVRITFAHNPAWEIPKVFMDCIRVVSFPLAPEAMTWTSAKTLYR